MSRHSRRRPLISDESRRIELQIKSLEQQCCNICHTLQMQHSLYLQTINRRNRNAKANLLHNLPRIIDEHDNDIYQHFCLIDQLYLQLGELHQQHERLAEHKPLQRLRQRLMQLRRQFLVSTNKHLLPLREAVNRWYSQPPAILNPEFVLPSAPTLSMRERKQQLARRCLGLEQDHIPANTHNSYDAEISDPQQCVVVRQIPSLQQWSQTCEQQLRTLEALSAQQTCLDDNARKFWELKIARACRDVKLQLQYNQQCLSAWQKQIARQRFYLQQKHWQSSLQIKWGEVISEHEQLQAIDARLKMLDKQSAQCERIAAIIKCQFTWLQYYQQVPSLGYPLCTPAEVNQTLETLWQANPHHWLNLNRLKHRIDSLRQDLYSPEKRQHPKVLSLLPQQLQSLQQQLQTQYDALRESRNHIQQWQLALAYGRSKKELQVCEGCDEQLLQHRSLQLSNLAKMDSDCVHQLQLATTLQQQLTLIKQWLFEQYFCLFSLQETEHCLQDCKQISSELTKQDKLIRQLSSQTQQTPWQVDPQSLWEIQQRLVQQFNHLNEYWECLGCLTDNAIPILRQQAKQLQSDLATSQQLITIKLRLQQQLTHVKQQQETIKQLIESQVQNRTCQHIAVFADKSEFLAWQRLLQKISQQFQQWQKHDLSQVRLTTQVKLARELVRNQHVSQDQRLAKHNLELLAKKIAQLQRYLNHLKQWQQDCFRARFKLGGHLTRQQLQSPPFNLSDKCINRYSHLAQCYHIQSQKIKLLQQGVTDIIMQLQQVQCQLQHLNFGKNVYFFEHNHTNKQYLCPLVNPQRLEDTWLIVQSKTHLQVYLNKHRIRLPAQPANQQQEHETLRQMVHQAIINGWSTLKITSRHKRMIQFACAHAMALNFPINWQHLEDDRFRHSKAFLQLVANERARLAEKGLSAPTQQNNESLQLEESPMVGS